jgi:hypothetical protein
VHVFVCAFLFQVYYPYLLMNKKRYAGLLWTKPDKWDKMDSKVSCSRSMRALLLLMLACAARLLVQLCIVLVMAVGVALLAGHHMWRHQCVGGGGVRSPCQPLQQGSRAETHAGWSRTVA